MSASGSKIMAIDKTGKINCNEKYNMTLDSELYRRFALAKSGQLCVMKIQPNYVEKTKTRFDLKNAGAYHLITIFG